MKEPIDLSMLLEALRKERPAKLSKTIKSKLRFSNAPLTADELCGANFCRCFHHYEVEVTEYQFRALAILKDNFHRYACRKYPPELTCVWSVPEFKPMFNEIHRGVAHFVSTGLSVHDALDIFINGKDLQEVVA